MAIHPRIRPETLPESSWDTHCHTFDPVNHPFEHDSPYIPPPASVESLLSAVPTRNFCIVMAMPEGVRPALALESVKKISSMTGRQARATIVLDFDKVSASELADLARHGVRSIRIHTKGAITGKLSGDQALQRYIETVVDRISPLGWSLDGQLKTAQWVTMAETITKLHRGTGIIFVADHCFYLRPEDMNSPAFQVCLQLVESGAVYVKLSGLDRLVCDGEIDRMETIVKSLAAAHCGERCLFGSDWPHVIPGNMREEVLLIDSYIELEYHRRWLDKKTFENLLVHNPKRLYE